MKKNSIFCLTLLLFIATGLSSCKKDQNSITPTGISGDYSVFAWNDLGMHCLNPTYDKLVILPPYNNVLVQVVKRGNPPDVVTTGITVSYKLTNNSLLHITRDHMADSGIMQ